MSDATHTPGRVRVVDEHHLAVDGGPVLRVTDHPHGSDWPGTPKHTAFVAHIRRLAAAWNACDGLPTPALERGAVAELLAACRTLCVAADDAGVLAAKAQARAALAKLEAAP